MDHHKKGFCNWMILAVSILLSSASTYLFMKSYCCRNDSSFDGGRSRRNVGPVAEKLSHPCLNETDPLYYISTYNKQVCRSLVKLAFRIFYERKSTDQEYHQWFTQCLNKETDAAKLSWSFSHADEHIRLLQHKRRQHEQYNEDDESNDQSGTTKPSRTKASTETPTAVITAATTSTIRLSTTATTPILSASTTTATVVTLPIPTEDPSFEATTLSTPNISETTVADAIQKANRMQLLHTTNSPTLPTSVLLTTSADVWDDQAQPSQQTSPVDSSEDERAVPLQMEMKNKEYSAQLEDHDSDEYKELSDGVEAALSDILIDTPGFKGVRVLGFKEGSLIVIYEVIFEDSESMVGNETVSVPTTVTSDRSNPASSDPLHEAAKRNVQKAIQTSLNDPMKREQLLNKSFLTDEDFETIDNVCSEEVKDLKRIKSDNKTAPVTPNAPSEFSTTPTLVPVTKTSPDALTNPYQVVFMKLRVTNMDFSQNLTDRNNEEFRHLEKKFTELIDPLLLSLEGYVGLEVMGFTTGSLIVSQELYFKDLIPANISGTIKDRLHAAASYFYYLDLHLDEDATQVLKPGEADVCEFVTCNMYSECVERNNYRADCVCRPGYIEVNPNVCISRCEVDPSYCKNGGKCEIKPGKGASCRCIVSYNWAYAGERCDQLVSHAVVIMSATSAVVLMASVLVVIAICYYAVTGTNNDTTVTGKNKKFKRRPEISSPQMGSLPSSFINDFNYIRQHGSSHSDSFTSASSFYSPQPANQADVDPRAIQPRSHRYHHSHHDSSLTPF